jgi:FtsH-binding integral membrane protein
MVTVILFYAVIFVGFGLWIFWRFKSNDLYNEYVLYGVMGGVCLTDLILLIFTYGKLTVVTIIALIISFLFSLMSNTAFLARSENFRETIEDRRMAIDLWKDIVIDVGYAFLLIQLLVIIKSTI